MKLACQRTYALILTACAIAGLTENTWADARKANAAGSKAVAAAASTYDDVDLLISRLWQQYSGTKVNPATIWQTVNATELFNFLLVAFPPEQGAIVGENGIYRETELELVYDDHTTLAASHLNKTSLFSELDVITAQEAGSRFSSKLGAALINLTPAGVSYYPLAQVREGLRVAAKFGGSGRSPRALFLQTSTIPPEGMTLAGMIVPSIEQGQTATPSMSFMTSAPCLTGPGTWTPCNNEVFVFWGHDPGGFLWTPAMGFEAVRDALTVSGYTITPLDARNPWVSTAGNEAQFVSLLSSHTVFFNAHGGDGGTALMQCYSDIAGFEWVAHPSGGNVKVATQECCERLQATGAALSNPDASEMNCAPSNPWERPSQLPDGSIYLKAPTWDAGAAGGLGDWVGYQCYTGSPGGTPVGGGVTNRCRIQVRQNFFGNLGQKSILAATQCYGGACYFTPTVADMVGFSNQINFDTMEICDSERMGKDILGEANYCKDESTPGWLESTATTALAGSCPGAHDILYPGSPSPLRNFQQSVTKRGAFLPQGESDPYEIYNCNMGVAANGLTMYEQAGIGGSGTMQVEIAPSVQSAALAGNTLSLVFTSPIRPSDLINGFQISTSSGTKLKLSSEPLHEPPTSTPTGVQATVEFTANLDFMDQTEWESEPEDLLDAYGYDQSIWPWRVEIRFTGYAPNGTKLIGNQGAIRKWIWGSKAEDNMIPPYSYNLGDFYSGGDTFEVWLPVRPSRTCCMPVIEWVTDQCLDRDETWQEQTTPIQNGCLCVENIPEDQCFVGTCSNPRDPLYPFNSVPGLTAEYCEGEYERFDGVFNLWNDCCQGSYPPNFVYPSCEEEVSTSFDAPDRKECPDSGEYLAVQIAYQHKSRPWDQGSPSQCAVIDDMASCGEPVCDPSRRK